VEKKQSDLCLEILRRFHKEGILNNLILIGSWCIYFYKEYFSENSYVENMAIKTRDIDFLVTNPSSIKHEVKVPDLLADLGFVTIFKGSKGYLRLDHPDLILEFLVPERGKGTNKPVALPKLGVNAVALRYLDFLAENTISIGFEGFHIRLPHPAAYALHKFIIFKRRRNIDKHDKDVKSALQVFRELVRFGREKEIRRIFKRMHKKWQETVLKNLESIDEIEAMDLLLKERGSGR